MRTITTMTNLTAAEILSTLDLAAVESAILNDEQGKPTLLAFDFEDAKKMVWSACKKWLVSDLNLLSRESLGIEEQFNINLGGYPVRGFLDLRGTYTRGQHQGKVVVADWKTTNNDLDLTWQGRLVDSKQWRLYAVVPPSADFISYRGINTKGKTREVYISVPPNIEDGVAEYFSGVGTMMSSISNRTIWPQHMPSACGAFGQTCPFINDCRNGTEPRYSLPAEDITLSYSGAGRFLGCPERYRRMKHAEEGIDGSDSTRRGNAVHRGLEAVWFQAFQLYGE